VSKTFICGFDVQKPNNECLDYTVPVTFTDELKHSDVNTKKFIDEMNELSDYRIFNCYMIVDKDLNFFYKNDEVTEQDMIQAFNVLCDSEFMNSEEIWKKQ